MGGFKRVNDCVMIVLHIEEVGGEEGEGLLSDTREPLGDLMEGNSLRRPGLGFIVHMYQAVYNFICSFITLILCPPSV